MADRLEGVEVRIGVAEPNAGQTTSIEEAPMRRVVIGFTLMVLCACQHSSAPVAPAIVRSRTNMPPLADVDFVQFRWESSSAIGEHFIAPNGMPIVVSDTVILDMAGIDSVWVYRPHSVADQWDVVIRLSRQASARVGFSSATHLHRQLAVIVDHHVTNFPIVEGPLTSIAELLSGVPKATADSLAGRVAQAIAALKPWQPVELRRLP